MRNALLAPLGALAFTAAVAGTSADYKGRCQYAQQTPQRHVVSDGACAITVGLIGSNPAGYRGALIAYHLQPASGAAFDIRVWKDGVAAVNGVPGKEVSAGKGGPLSFITVEGDELHFTAPPADAF